jgi:hypothetical protein
MNEFSKSLRNRGCLAAVGTLLLISFALYWKVLGFEYVWDDSLLFLDKTALVNEPLSWQLLADPVLPGTSYLRPLVFLTLYAEFHIFGQNPAISHSINLLIYACNVLLVFFVGRRLASLLKRSNSILLGWISAVMYAVHPSLVESTAWVAGRFDLMVTFFILAAIAVYIDGSISSKIKKLSLIMFFMGAALLSKELGAVLPAVLICIWFALQPVKKNWFGGQGHIKQAIVDNWVTLLLSIFVLVAYLFLRKSSVGGIYHSTLSLDYLLDAVIKQLLPFEALKFYFVKVFFPFSSINPLHPLSELNAHEGFEIASSLAVAGALIFLIFQCVGRKSPAAWVFFAGLVCLLPVLHLIPLSTGGNIGHERFLTAPLAFFCLALSLVDYKALVDFVGLKRQFLNRLLLLAGGGWVLIALFTTYTVQLIWASDLQLWNWAYHKHPSFAFARYNYMYGALKSGRPDLVEREVDLLQKRDGGLEVSDQILYANVLLRRGNPESMSYLEGIMFALPKFHEMEDGKKKVFGIPVPKIGMAGVYGDYSMGLMMFKSDAEAALKYSNIAEWYLAESEKIPLLYPKVAILIALGRDQDAQDLLDYLEPLFYTKKERLKKDPAAILNNYCKNLPSQQLNRCQELVSKAEKMVESAGRH